MIKLDQFRTASEYREILRIFQRASALPENLLWQSHALGKNIVPVHHFEIDFVSRGLAFYYDSQKYKFDTALPLYSKLIYRSSIFKIHEFTLGPNVVHCNFPAEIKTEELRGMPRHLFSPDKEVLIGLKSAANGPTHDTGNELLVRGMDISRSGLGVIVSETNRSFLKNNRILWITRLLDGPLYPAILAEVVYINNEIDPGHQVKKQKNLKVGLRLSKEFPEEVFKRFLES